MIRRSFLIGSGASILYPAVSPAAGLGVSPDTLGGILSRIAQDYRVLAAKAGRSSDIDGRAFSLMGYSTMGTLAEEDEKARVLWGTVWEAMQPVLKGAKTFQWSYAGFVKTPISRYPGRYWFYARASFVTDAPKWRVFL